MQTLLKYFPQLSPSQVERMERLLPLYSEWNEKINVVSRKDIENMMLHHVLHSLAIVRVMPFKSGANVLDLGTGGGFPGIPLAIFYPDTQFTLVDSIGKKITVVKAIAEALELSNVQAFHKRAEEMPKLKYDFVVTRAVAEFERLIAWSRPLLRKQHIHELPNGILALKGGNLKPEISAIGRKEYIELYPIQKYFPEPFFAEKAVAYVQG